MIQKTKVFIPVDIFDKETVGVVSMPYKNDTYVKEQELYCFTGEELIQMRREDYENGYFQKGVYQDEICTPDDYMSALLLIIN